MLRVFVVGPSSASRCPGAHVFGGKGCRPDALNDDQRETVDAVLGFYGDRSPQWLNDLTHMETPWQSARLRIGLQE